MLKKRIVWIKGKKEVLIKVDGVWVYKYRRCGCPCNERIIFFETSQKYFGVPTYISRHYQYTDEFKKMQSQKMSGENNFWFGKHLYEETKEKLRNANIGKHASKKTRKLLSKLRTGEGNSFFGKHHTKKTRKKMSGPRPNASGKNNHMYGKPSPKGSGHSKGCYYNSPLQGNVWLRSTYELGYANYLDSKQIIWKHEHKTFKLSNETSYTPDFFLVKKKKYIEIKGYTSKIAQEKMDLFRQEYPNIKFKILYSEDLVRKGIL